MTVQRYAIAAALGLLFCPVFRGEVRILKGFTLIDGTGRPAGGASAMVIDNGRITWIGPPGPLKSPGGSTKTPRRRRDRRPHGQVRDARNHQSARASRQYGRASAGCEVLYAGER